MEYIVVLILWIICIFVMWTRNEELKQIEIQVDNLEKRIDKLMEMRAKRNENRTD